MGAPLRNLIGIDITDIFHIMAPIWWEASEISPVFRGTRECLLN